MLKKIVLVFAAVALAKAQIPSLGWCPEYVPMANFDMSKFLGVWYEAERYFQLTEVVSRCLTSNYTIGADGKIHVSNEVTNRLTGIKRVLEGEVKAPASKSEEGKLQVKYTAVPLTPETHYSVLETDYDNYAVLWSCSGIGPIHAQNAWLMTRERIPSGKTLQQAYGVLDKYKISKRFFVKTDQAECAFEAAQAAPTPAPAPAAASVPIVAEAVPAKEEPEAVPVKEEPEAVPAQKSADGVYLRSATIVEEAAKETPKEEAELPVKAADPIAEKPAEIPAEEKPVLAEEKPEPVVAQPIAPETIPEVILKVAESAKETPAPIAEPALPVAEESKTVEVAVPAESKPEVLAATLPVEPIILEDGAKPALEAAAEETKVEAAPVEQPKPVEAIESADVPVAAVAAEEPKPLEAVPAVKSPLVAEAEAPLVPAEPVLVEKIEAPAAVVPSLEPVAAKSGIVAAEKVETPESTSGKAAELPVADEPKVVLPEAAEPSIILKEGEQLPKSPEAVVLPETIVEPVVQETLVLPAETPLKPVQAVAAESKPEVIAAEAPQTSETKP